MGNGMLELMSNLHCSIFPAFLQDIATTIVEDQELLSVSQLFRFGFDGRKSISLIIARRFTTSAEYAA